MQALAVIASLTLMVYGFATAGVSGAVTGAGAAITVGSGLAIARAEERTQVAETSSRKRSVQRIGGAIAAIAALGGAVYGGWTWGWAWSLGGFLAGGAFSTVAGYLYLRFGNSSASTKVEPSGPEAEADTDSFLNVSPEEFGDISAEDLANLLVTSAWQIGMLDNRSVKTIAEVTYSKTNIEKTRQMLELTLFPLSAIELSVATHLPEAMPVRLALRSRLLELFWNPFAEADGAVPEREEVYNLMKRRLEAYVNAAEKIADGTEENVKTRGQNLGRLALSNIVGATEKEPDPEKCLKLAGLWIAVAEETGALIPQFNVQLDE